MVLSTIVKLNLLAKNRLIIRLMTRFLKHFFGGRRTDKLEKGCSKSMNHLYNTIMRAIASTLFHICLSI